MADFDTMAPDSLTYVCVTSPNLAKMQRNIALIMPYVDRAVVVIGRRDAEAEKVLKSVPNLKLVYREWDDSFKNQYQVALNHITGGWMLWLDDDEIPSQEMLQSLRPIIQQSQGARAFDTVGFPCLGEDGKPSDYHRELLVAWNPNLRFEIDLHQGMVGKMRGARAPVGYHHPKDEMGGMRGACRNWFIGGSWADTKEDFEFLMAETGQDPRINPGTPLNPQPYHPAYPLQDGFKTKEWVEMKDILGRNHPEVKYFGHLNELIVSGKVCQEFVDWAERNNRDNNKRPGMGELYSYHPYIQAYRKAK